MANERIRWSLFVDIEGFSHFIRNGKEDLALKLFGRLAEWLYRIGDEVYSEDNERLFIDNFGDGFLITPDHSDLNLERPISIAIFLHRLMLSDDQDFGLIQSAISQGKMADVRGTYPEIIRTNMNNGRLDIGWGRMTLNKVMGTALVNAYGLSEHTSGPVVIVDKEIDDGMEEIENLVVTKRTEKFSEIDWLNSQVPLVNELEEKLNAAVLNGKNLEGKFELYLEQNPEYCSQKKGCNK